MRPQIYPLDNGGHSERRFTALITEAHSERRFTPLITEAHSDRRFTPFITEEHSARRFTPLIKGADPAQPGGGISRKIRPNQLSATTGFFNTPSFVISTSTTSPATMSNVGSSVPIQIMSPGYSVL